MPEAGQHLPVLLPEVLRGLAVRADGLYVDATYGRGGHAQAILDRLGPEGRLLAIDKDPQAVRVARLDHGSDGRFSVEQGSFAMLERLVGQRGWCGKVNGILLDLGVSSPQLDDPQRGFSFLRDGPLDMRMDPEQGISAAQWLGEAGEAEITRVLFQFGEERHARRIARAIVAARAQAPIASTGRLAELIAAVSPTREPGKHPATRSFQAIRIFLNRELDELQDCLAQALEVLVAGGRLCVISFHSLEDRIVKRFMRDHTRDQRFPADLPVPQHLLQPRLRLLGGALRASEGELRGNPRSRSATLRMAEKLA